ncbi:MAG TPA: LysR family transcriptional regulator [Pseudonocardia sp.]|jgi:DNA-binding transcriptional LysR family regulator|nr:LysR family transcriptional regulator [Pseudonocardia sp.]
MDRVETRELVYFVTVAEELHFGRAAERLGMAQPPLSRAIGRLERRIGVQLFERSSRRVALTGAGQVFLREARKALGAVDGAVRRAQQAAGPRRLLLAVRTGTGADLLTDALDDYARQPGAVPVELVFSRDQVADVRAGAADVALLCGTADRTGLEVTELAVESAVVLLPAADPLAARTSLTSHELRADSRFQADCPPVDLDEILVRVALGQLVVVVGGGTTDRLGSRVAAVPVTDLPDTHLVLCWPRQTPHPARDAFVRAAALGAARRRATPDASAVPAPAR